MSKPHIAFLGLGTMGAGMARRLLAGGFPLAVYNRNPEKSTSFAAEGARVASSARDAAAGAAIIISMVSDDHASRGLWLGSDGALMGAAPGTICVESSTVTVGWIHELAAAVSGKQCELIDAPVSGSKLQAAAGELNFLTGGPVATIEKIRPVLAAMGKSIIPLGPLGSGAMVKLVNNYLSGVQLASLAEGLAVIERSGVDRAKALEILTTGTPGSPMVKTAAARMAASDFTPNFLLRLMAKDLGYAIGQGEEMSLELTTGMAALAVFQNAIAEGQGEKDIAAVIQQFRRAKR